MRYTAGWGNDGGGVDGGAVGLVVVVGCHLAGSLFDSYGYADDITLLAPSRQALQILLNICEEFSSSHSMLFALIQTLQHCNM